MSWIDKIYHCTEECEGCPENKAGGVCGIVEEGSILRRPYSLTKEEFEEIFKEIEND